MYKGHADLKYIFSYSRW